MEVFKLYTWHSSLNCQILYNLYVGGDLGILCLCLHHNHTICFSSSSHLSMVTHIDLPAWLQLYGQLYVTLSWQPWTLQFSPSIFAFRVTFWWLRGCILGHTTQRGEVVFFSQRCLLSQQPSRGQNFSSSSFVKVEAWLATVSVHTCQQY